MYFLTAPEFHDPHTVVLNLVLLTVIFTFIVFLRTFFFSKQWFFYYYPDRLHVSLQIFQSFKTNNLIDLSFFLSFPKYCRSHRLKFKNPLWACSCIYNLLMHVLLHTVLCMEEHMFKRSISQPPTVISGEVRGNKAEGRCIPSTQFPYPDTKGGKLWRLKQKQTFSKVCVELGGNFFWEFIIFRTSPSSKSCKDAW